MNKYAYATATVIMAAMLAASPVRAEDHAPAAGAQDPQSIENQKAEEALRFKHKKEEMLLMFDNRMAEMKKKKDCVQAAADKEALQKCMPPMMGGGHGGKEGHMMCPSGGDCPMHGGKGGPMMGGPLGQPGAGAPDGMPSPRK